MKTVEEYSIDPQLIPGLFPTTRGNTLNTTKVNIQKPPLRNVVYMYIHHSEDDTSDYFSHSFRMIDDTFYHEASKCSTTRHGGFSSSGISETFIPLGDGICHAITQLLL